MKVKKGVFEKDFMKIKLSSDDNLHLNKMLKLHILLDLFLKKMINTIHKFLKTNVCMNYRC